MTSNKNYKTAVRAHMAATGMNYTAAARALAATPAKQEPQKAAKVSRKRFVDEEELCQATGLRGFQVRRAVKAGLIEPSTPSAGGSSWRWPIAIVDVIKPQVPQITTAVGEVPDMGVKDASDYLSRKLERDVTMDAVADLARQGLLRRWPQPNQRGDKTWYYYCGVTLAAFEDNAAVSQADWAGRTLITSQVIQELDVRRADFDALLDRGWLVPLRYVRNPNGSRGSRMAIFRRGDIDDLLKDPGIDWDAVRSVPKGRRSPLAKLPER